MTQMNIETYEFQRVYLPTPLLLYIIVLQLRQYACSHLPEAPAEIPDDQMCYARDTIMIPSIGSSACAMIIRAVCCHPSLRLVNAALDV